MFTSPYIERFEERIRINGENISLQRLSEVTLKVKDAAEAMASHPTEFELMTAVAFTYFAEEKCDIVVAEVGLGGRLDSTNVIRTVEVCVFAPISKTKHAKHARGEKQPNRTHSPTPAARAITVGKTQRR